MTRFTPITANPRVRCHACSQSPQGPNSYFDNTRQRTTKTGQQADIIVCQACKDKADTGLEVSAHHASDAAPTNTTVSQGSKSLFNSAKVESSILPQIQVLNARLDALEELFNQEIKNLNSVIDDTRAGLKHVMSKIK